ncbi:MAG: antibiotic biosynthesis monooxygenase [Acidobacteria bacterium]|nr:antibiotic biosynthesis monooxygenase [Acidobacteriota bacterium]
MIVITVRVLVSPEKRRELVQIVRSLLRPIRGQKGCLGSYFYYDLGDEDALCLIEEWETQEDLNNYFRSDSFAVLFGAINLLKKTSELEFRLLTPMAGIEAVEAAREKIEPWPYE